MTLLKNRKKFSLGLAAALFGSGAAFACFSVLSTAAPATSGFTKVAEYADYGLDYMSTGASQVKGDGGGSMGSNCASVNTTSSSAGLNVPPQARNVKAYLYWVGLEQHASRGYPSVTTLSDTASFTPSGGQATAVKGTKRLVASGTYNGGAIQYAGYSADVTDLIKPSINGQYSVAISGGIPNLCAYQGENARAWQLVVLYQTPSTDFSRVYLYDGLEYLVNTTKTFSISGYQAPVGKVSSMTAFVAQGDSTLPGEYATTSDTSFPDFPSGFANETVNGGATGANGQAVDIHTLTGNLTAGSTSMNVTVGTNQDVIVPVTFVMRMASVPGTIIMPPTTTTAPAVTTTVAAPTTTAAVVATTIVPATTVPATTTLPATTTTVPSTTTVPATTTLPATTTTVPPTTTPSVSPNSTANTTTTTPQVSPTGVTAAPTTTTTLAPAGPPT
jgi:hypothetical protein